MARLSTKHRFWSKVALPNSEGCMLWLKTLDECGYGQFYLNGKIRSHRLSLIWSDGEPLSADLMATHSCRNRHCVAPEHLSWATHDKNMADRVRDGIGNGKLTRANIPNVFEMYNSNHTQKQIAEHFGVSNQLISKILNEKRWKSFG